MTPPLEADLDAATVLFGSRASLDVVRFLNSRPGRAAYWRELAAALSNYPHASLRRRLEALEDIGAVTATVPQGAPRGDRRGTSVIYAVDTTRINGIIAAAVAVLGPQAR